MVSRDEPAADPDSGNGADVRAEALDIISDVLQWRLADGRWRAIQQVLAAMDDALAAGDVDALAAATADLELAGPLRITRIGAPPIVPPTPPVRDLLNRLVHSLGDSPVAQQHQVEDTREDDGGTPRR
jgi:hypothetical protein